MATKDWNGLKGKKWNVGVGVTMTEALNDTQNPTRVYVTTDGKLVMNGEVMNGVLATVSYMVFYAEEKTSNDDIVDAFTMRLCNGEAVGNASGIVKVLDLCTEHGLVLKDQDMGMQIGVSMFEDMGVKKYSLSGVGIGQQEKGVRPALFNLVLEYNAENATLKVAHHMANFDVSLIKKLGYNQKSDKVPYFPPCVHKAIPTCPKRGRRYYSSNGVFHFNLSYRVLKRTGKTFVWDENKFGKIISVRNIRTMVPDIHHSVHEDLSKYKSINTSSFEKFFSFIGGNLNIGDAQYEFKIGDGSPLILTIESDEVMFGADGFKFSTKEAYVQEKTASPYFVINNYKVCFVKPVIFDMNREENYLGYFIKYAGSRFKHFRGFYKKYPRGYRKINGFESIDDKKMGKRWKEVCTKFNSSKCSYLNFFFDRFNISNELPLNNQSKLFRLYPCKWNGFRRKYKSNCYVEVYVNKKATKKEDIIKKV